MRSETGELGSRNPAAPILQNRIARPTKTCESGRRYYLQFCSECPLLRVVIPRIGTRRWRTGRHNARRRRSRPKRRREWTFQNFFRNISLQSRNRSHLFRKALRNYFLLDLLLIFVIGVFVSATNNNKLEKRRPPHLIQTHFVFDAFLAFSIIFFHS